MKQSVILALLPFAVACGILGISEGRERILEVAPYKAACTGLFETLCLQIREPGTTEFRNTFQTPRGFDYEWGFDYLIRVREREIENPPADGSSIEVTLESVLSRVPVARGSRFELVVVTEPGLQRTEPGFWFLYNGPESLMCPQESACDELQKLIDTHERLRFTLEFPSVAGHPFVVVDWAACRDAFGPCVPVP